MSDTSNYENFSTFLMSRISFQSKAKSVDLKVRFCSSSFISDFDQLLSAAVERCGLSSRRPGMQCEIRTQHFKSNGIPPV